MAEKSDPRTEWCATCRRTFEPGSPEFLSHDCERAILARRGEYALTAREGMDARKSLCRCGATIVWSKSPAGKALPLSRVSARSVPCPQCTGGSRIPTGPCYSCLGYRVLYLLLSHHADCPLADEFRRSSAGGA